MRRGFKAEAERIAESVRKEMGIKLTERMDAIQLAKHVGAQVKSAAKLTDVAKLEALEELQPGAFSACTFSFDDRDVIVFSPLSSAGRRQSDIAHEVAHLLLNHEVKQVQQIGEMNFFTCDADEEQEANWLAGCLLLPRALMLAAAKRGMTIVEISETYGVSEKMAGFRLRTTGVEKQLTASKRH